MDLLSSPENGGLNFATAARRALAYLYGKTGLALWIVTRAEGDDWIVLESEDHGYGVQAPALFHWTDSFCSRMVLGQGPRVAPSSDSVPVYAAAPIAAQLKIGAYIGAPLTRPDGTLFGTICAIDPLPQPESLKADLPLVELIAGLLSTILAFELEVAHLARQAERAKVEAETDSLTGLYNRRAWDRMVAMEEDRCRRYGHPACVVAVDLDGLKTTNDTLGHAAGDLLIVTAAQLVKSAVRKSDVVARVGGDEFFVLATECDAAVADTVTERIRSLLAGAGVTASVGMARRVPPLGLAETIEEADRRMYAEKQTRKQLVRASKPQDTGKPEPQARLVRPISMCLESDP